MQKTECFEIDLNDNIAKTELEKLNTVSKEIPVELKQKLIVNKVNENGTKSQKQLNVAKLVKV